MKLEVITHQPVRTPKPVPLLFVHGAWNEHFLPYVAERGYAPMR
jgi:hypothetical protein